MIISDISEIIWEMTNPLSTAMETKTISRYSEDINKLDEYVKNVVKILQNNKPETKTVGDAIKIFWDFSAYFFLCHIYTVLQLNNLSEERSWLKTKLSNLFKILKEKIKIEDNWIYWQYAQIPWKENEKPKKKLTAKETYEYYEELLKDQEKSNQQWNKQAKAAVMEFDPNADYEGKKCDPKFAKDTPVEKSDWLDSNLKALKNFIATGECDDNHFAYALYLLLRQRDLGMPRPPVDKHYDHKYDAIIHLASFAAYIDNKAELFSNVDNYLADNFYWFLRKEQPGRTDLNTWGGLSGLIQHSCCHMNYEGDLYTNITENDELNSWIQLMGFFNLISLNEAFIMQRCFGYLFAPPNSTDSTFFVKHFRNIVRQNPCDIKDRPGFIFCLYWMIHFMNEHDFNEVFLEEEVIGSADTYCKENGIIPIEKRHYIQNALNILQKLLFCILFDLTSKLEINGYEKKEALIPLMQKIKNRTWCDKHTLLGIFNQLGEKTHLNSELKTMLNDFVHNDETTKSMVLLVYNLSKFLRQDTRWLVNEVSYIKELQNTHLRIPEHTKVRQEEKNEELSGNKESKISKHQKKLSEIDSGFKALSFTQKIPSFQNLILSRDISVKIFIDSDVNTLCSDNTFFRSQYRSLTQAKYAYFDRNMATHYAAFSKVEDLFEPRNFPDSLTALYDLTHDKLNLQWFAMRNNQFEKITAYPYYQKFLAECLDEMVEFVKKKIPISQVFDDEGVLVPNRKDLKDLGQKFWQNCSIQKDKLKDCLNILYCNSDLMKWRTEYIEKDEKIVEYCYPEYITDFWNAYKYEMAVYLIKVAIDLTALYK